MRPPLEKLKQAHETLFVKSVNEDINPTIHAVISDLCDYALLLEKALEEVGDILKECCSAPVCVAHITTDDDFQCNLECLVNKARIAIRLALKAGESK